MFFGSKRFDASQQRKGGAGSLSKLFRKMNFRTEYQAYMAPFGEEVCSPSIGKTQNPINRCFLKSVLRFRSINLHRLLG